jgi:hypothetical protein
MWDELLELVLNVALSLLEALCDFTDRPRFYACTILSLAGAGLSDCLINPAKLAHIVSVVLVVIGLGMGIVWEWGSR